MNAVKLDFWGRAEFIGCEILMNEFEVRFASVKCSKWYSEWKFPKFLQKSTIRWPGMIIEELDVPLELQVCDNFEVEYII